MNCPVCKAPLEEEGMDYVVEIDGKKVKLEDVPTLVCPQCDFTLVTEEVGEAIEDMLDHLDSVQEDDEQEA